MRSKIVAATLLALAAPGCAEGRAEDNGPAVSRNYTVAGFTAIESAGPFDLEVTTGKPVSVAARGPQALVDRLEVRVENNVLKIGMRRGSGSWTLADEEAKIAIAVPTLGKVGSSGSGDVRVDRIAGEAFEAGVAGSGDLDLPSVAVKRLKMGIAGSGSASAQGSADELELGIAGSGDADLGKLTAATARIGVAGSGSVKARVTGEARAEVAGSGDIDIEGGARCTTSRLGSGSVNCS